MGDSLDLFFMTQRVRRGPNGWTPGYGFELSIRICFLNRAIHPKLGWGSQEGMSVTFLCCLPPKKKTPEPQANHWKNIRHIAVEGHSTK